LLILLKIIDCLPKVELAGGEVKDTAPKNKKLKNKKL